VIQQIARTSSVTGPKVRLPSGAVCAVTDMLILLPRRGLGVGRVTGFEWPGKLCTG